MSRKVCGVKVAVTVVASLTVTTHVPVPLQPPPLQPLNKDPGAGVADSATSVSCGNAAAHVAPQSMPSGVLVTVPAPAPVGETASTKFGVTMTVRLAVALLPAASWARTVSTFVPGWRMIPSAVQFVVPVAAPVPPRPFAHVTWVTPTSSDAVPLSVRDELTEL